MIVPKLTAGAVAQSAAGLVDDAVEAATTLPTTIHGLDAARGATLAQGTNVVEAVEQALAGGRFVGELRVMPSHGTTGVLQQGTVELAGTPSLRVETVLKRVGAPQERFGWRMARALGIGHLVPPVGVRDDGIAAMGLVHGTTFEKAGIVDAAALRRVLVDYHAARGLAPDAAASAARTDHELLAFLDWMTANRDRKLANAMRGTDGSVAFIDNAGMLRGELEDPLRPRLKHALYPLADGDPPRIALSDAARRRIERALDDETIADAHRELRRSATMRDLEPWEAQVLARATSPTQLERLLLRRDHAVHSGVLEFAPVTTESRLAEARAFSRSIHDGTFDTWLGTPRRTPIARHAIQGVGSA